MADRVHDHQRSLPPFGAVLAPDPALLEVPVRQLALQPRLDLVFRIGPVLRTLHGSDSRSGQALSLAPGFARRRLPERPVLTHPRVRLFAFWNTRRAPLAPDEKCDARTSI